MDVRPFRRIPINLEEYPLMQVQGEGSERANFDAVDTRRGDGGCVWKANVCVGLGVDWRKDRIRGLRGWDRLESDWGLELGKLGFDGKELKVVLGPVVERN